MGTGISINKPVLVIAGPGAGKTYEMVDRISDEIPHLEPHRILAAITYTNAATNLIRERLTQRINIPPNVFIGTNHSFCFQFIFKPFGQLMGNLPREMVFADLDYDKMAKGVRGQKQIVINALKKKHLARGYYGYDQILSVSAAILKEHEHVRRILSNRLQYLFVDEFQDANGSQFHVFDAIRKEKKTTIYAVGDPEQYILRFTDSIKKYDNIAIKKFMSGAEVLQIKENHRSCKEIVSFINHFHCEIEQKAETGRCVPGGVYFIERTDLDGIISVYRDLTQVLEARATPVVIYYLSYENKTFDNVARKWRLTPVSNESTKGVSLMDEVLKLISSLTGANAKQLCETYKLDRIGLRKKCLYLAQAITKGEVREVETLESFIENNLGLRVDKTFPKKATADKVKKLSSDQSMDEGVRRREMYSTIHRAKGLEADAVLAVAERKSQLKKWLMTDKKARCEDKSDMCRIGYVAFSRAKTILCIACLEQINNGLDEELQNLGVSTI